MPPSVETSTPATTPVELLAVPVIVVAVPSLKLAPPVGEVIDEVGGVVLVDWVAALSPETCAPLDWF